MSSSWAITLVLIVLVGDLTLPARADTTDAKAFLDPHNAARAHVGVGGLVWSNSLMEYALGYAEKQRDQHQCQLVHSQGPYGENLFEGSGKAWTPEDAINSWVAERGEYDYKSNSCAAGKVCGHYTQVVWAKTKELGCASVTCHDGSIFIICSYNPPGNYVDEWPYMAENIAEM